MEEAGLDAWRGPWWHYQTLLTKTTVTWRTQHFCKTKSSALMDIPTCSAKSLLRCYLKWDFCWLERSVAEAVCTVPAVCDSQNSAGGGGGGGGHWGTPWEKHSIIHLIELLAQGCSGGSQDCRLGRGTLLSIAHPHLFYILPDLISPQARLWICSTPIKKNHPKLALGFTQRQFGLSILKQTQVLLFLLGHRGVVLA